MASNSDCKQLARPHQSDFPTLSYSGINLIHRKQHCMSHNLTESHKLDDNRGVCVHIYTVGPNSSVPANMYIDVSRMSFM